MISLLVKRKYLNAVVRAQNGICIENQNQLYVDHQIKDCKIVAYSKNEVTNFN